MLSRRNFLKTVVASAPLLISAKALGREGPGANEQVNVGFIGLGGRCKQIAETCLKIPGKSLRSRNRKKRPPILPQETRSTPSETSNGSHFSGPLHVPTFLEVPFRGNDAVVGFIHKL